MGQLIGGGEGETAVWLLVVGWNFFGGFFEGIFKCVFHIYELIYIMQGGLTKSRAPIRG